jgi:hypothetical protein
MPCRDLAASLGFDNSTTPGRPGMMITEKCRAGERAPSETRCRPHPGSEYVDKDISDIPR